MGVVAAEMGASKNYSNQTQKTTDSFVAPWLGFGSSADYLALPVAGAVEEASGFSLIWGLTKIGPLKMMLESNWSFRFWAPLIDARKEIFIGFLFHRPLAVGGQVLQ